MENLAPFWKAQQATLSGYFSEILDLLQTSRQDNLLQENLLGAAQACASALSSGQKVLLAGNGGSAADAQHIAGEFVSRFKYDRPGLAAIALTTDSSILTSVANDYGYECVFSRQIEALGRPGDIFIAYSTSGNSESIIRGLRTAREQELTCVAFTGNRRGPICSHADYLLEVPSGETPRIQEVHAVLGHLLCGLVESALFPRSVI